MWLHRETDAALVHQRRRLGHTVYRANSALAKAIGVMGRRGVPAGTVLVFDFDQRRPRSVHMVGVRAPIRVWWLTNGRINHSAQLAPWTGVGKATADTIVELPATAPAGGVGDRVAIR